jgi:hypothetical protein
MTRTQEGSGGDGYGRTQQEAAPFRLAAASYLEAQIDPFHSPLVRLGWIATKTLGMCRTCTHVATRDPRARGSQGCRGLVQPSSWSESNPTAMRELARVGTSCATLAHPYQRAVSLLLGPMVPTYACPLMWPSRHILLFMLQTWRARRGRGCPRVMRTGVQWGDA